MPKLAGLNTVCPSRLCGQNQEKTKPRGSENKGKRSGKRYGYKTVAAEKEGNWMIFPATIKSYCQLKEKSSRYICSAESPLRMLPSSCENWFYLLRSVRDFYSMTNFPRNCTDLEYLRE
ncbi:hypothetical protein QAD02_016890 [Eretmocerus hayati]|uniref:Uncharacterized protein n=1 Tax=Eretmocerus hayati TaxID=131215 RepID=A0ACC2PDF2_9HYME|nr:hypothetical protein QAD02_016890 [Eretmocerus hayati]